MTYPVAREWASVAAVTLTTTPAAVFTEANIDSGVPKGRRIKWLGVYPDGACLYGGANIAALTQNSDGMKLTTAEWMFFEFQGVGNGPLFYTASGTTTLRVILGLE